MAAAALAFTSFTVRRIIRRMSLIDGKSWWEENQGSARRLFAICFFVALVLVIILFNSEIKEFFSSHSWWQDALVGLAGITAPVLAYFELRHSGEANQIRREANEFRAEANRLQNKVAELEEEKASHLAQIAANTQRPVSQAERRAAILRRHLGARAAVSEGKGVWGTSPEIAEVSEENVVALFSPRSPSSGAAWCAYVHCDDLEIIELPLGSLQLRVLKRYGDIVQLGEITRWQDRFQKEATPVFAKGDCVGYATFVKPGSPEKRSLYVYASKDGANSFLLEASTGERPTGDNVEISKTFAIMYVEYLAAGFTRSTGTGSSGNSQHYRLFLP